jgi:hypothetical protein
MRIRDLDPRQLLHLATHRAYRSCFAGPNGERVLVDMAHRSHIGRALYRGDRDEMLINEGKRLFMVETLEILGTTEKELLDRMQARETDNDD